MTDIDALVLTADTHKAHSARVEALVVLGITETNQWHAPCDWGAMSQPRCIRPGRTWMITRRATRRHFLLRPDHDGTTQRLYWYATAVLAKKFGIVLHAVQMLSTHIHEVLTDVQGNLPAFLRERNRAFANALKCHRGWPEEVFQRAPANCVELIGEEAILRQIGYTIANCVDAGLVESPEAWPGVTVTAGDIGTRVVRVARPTVYFDPKNPVWPAEAEISIAMPDLLVAQHGIERAKTRIVLFVEKAVRHARAGANAAGRVATSIANLLGVAFTKRSRSFERFGSREPTFATGGKPDISKAAFAERRLFYETYQQARRSLRQGNLPAVFPEGTWRWTHELLPPDTTQRVPQRVQCQSAHLVAKSSMSVGSSSRA